MQVDYIENSKLILPTSDSFPLIMSHLMLLAYLEMILTYFLFHLCTVVNRLSLHHLLSTASRPVVIHPSCTCTATRFKSYQTPNDFSSQFPPPSSDNMPNQQDDGQCSTLDDNRQEEAKPKATVVNQEVNNQPIDQGFPAFLTRDPNV